MFASVNEFYGLWINYRGAGFRRQCDSTLPTVPCVVYRSPGADSLIRAIGFAAGRLGIEFCCKLRFETAARFYELGFGPGSVKQHGVKSFRPQHQESKHKREYDFRSEPHDSLLGQALLG
jgi:hypothetical protein